MKFEVDGNDGTGKSYRVPILRQVLPTVEIKDRGLFSDATLDERIFEGDKNAVEAFRRTVRENTDVLYMICTCSIRKSQERILARGGSLDEEFHTEADLKKYNERFEHLLELVKDCPNVIRVGTETDLP